FYFNNEIIKFDKKNKTLISTQQKFNYAYLFNCAGTGTDTIAKMFGLAQNYRLLPFKGIYYELKKENQYLVNGNIYPVPDLNLPFLGVHFTRSIHGNVYVGPTAIPAFGRENYGIFQGMDFEAFRIMKDIFSMYCKNHQNFRMLIHSEMKKYLKSHFVANAKKLVPSIHSNHLTSSQKVGIRPQLINIHKKKIELDYIIEKTENSTHILNAISPAFTSAFSFAEWVVNSMEDKVC
ncbi:MAG TPA: FAD-dependent oxidoreductase, partial [Gammaproteobacteria bacterium]|nr:FAD-dependent oxidoreductase [Gammaproteobacteria bacterium]